eukprot:798477-Pleurochrysis_carterae.AAC.1
MRREQSSDAYFWAVAPSAHCGNVIRVASVSALKATMLGISQSGACQLVFQDELSARIVSGVEKSRGSPDDFVGFGQFACVFGQHVRKPHNVFSVSDRRRPAVGRAFAREKPRNEKDEH